MQRRVFRISFLTAAATTASRNRARCIRDRELLRFQCASVGSGMLHLLSRVIPARDGIFMGNRDRALFSFRAHTIGLVEPARECTRDSYQCRLDAFRFFFPPIYSTNSVWIYDCIISSTNQINTPFIKSKKMYLKNLHM